MKNILLLRGVAGSGKSSLASTLCKLVDNCVVCTADDYMIENGEYVFKPEKLGFAHKSCQNKFVQALKDKCPLVIVANTSTKLQDFKFYLEKGKEYGYTVHSVVLENRHGGIDAHNVPEETLQKQERNIKNSLKLR